MNGEKLSLIWFVIGVLLLVFEFAYPGIVSMFFGLGSIIVSIILLIFPQISINYQLLLFIVISISMLILLRERFKSIFSGIFKFSRRESERMMSNIGKKAMVVKEIVPDREGRIEVNGTTWKAIADYEIKKGEMVEIIDQINITFKVKKIDKEE